MSDTTSAAASVVDIGAHAPALHNNMVNNNNNNMVSAGPSPSSSISPSTLHCNNDMIPQHTSAVALAAAAAAASMASIEAIGFIDQQQSKLEKGTSNGEGSPKYISL